MKITLEISDAILLRAKAVASAEKTTLRSLMEEGLAKVLVEREVPKPFSAKPVTFKGKGLSPEFEHASWSTIRDAAYHLETQ